MNNISKYISYKEAIRSRKAKSLGIENIPNAEQLENMKVVGSYLFDPMREHFGVPIYVSSFFRHSSLPIGSKTSDHKKGCAIDIDADAFGKVSNRDIFYWFLKSGLEFDQLIWEYGDDNEPAWVHVSHRKNGVNRRQVLVAKRNSSGKTYYESFKY